MSRLFLSSKRGSGITRARNEILLFFFPDLVAFDDVRKKVRRASVKETWARVSTAPTHRATTAPDLERLRTALD